MKKILIVPDVDFWAIGKLSKAISVYNKHWDIKILCIHPKHVAEHLNEFREAIKDRDLIHFQYWNTADQLFNLIPEIREKKIVLTHHNQKNLLSADWSWIDILVCHTLQAQNKLKEKYENVEIIRHGIDLNYFTFTDSEEYLKANSIGYIGRIVPWKRLKDIAWAARETGLPIVFMGKLDKPNYFNELSQAEMDNIDFAYQEVDDYSRIDVYKKMAIYINFSDDWHEEGPLPLLEAMACGVPVITTPSGIAKEIIKDGENGLIVNFGDREMLKAKIKELMNNENLRMQLRKNAWNTVKNMPDKKMAYEYSKLYYKVLYQKPLVSVITPTFNRKDNLAKIAKSLLENNYPAIEWIICDDNSDKELKIENTAYQLAEIMPFNIKYLNTEYKGYGLAMARNMGIIEAEGKYLLFLDDRMMVDKLAIKKFIEYAENNIGVTPLWQFGDKGSKKKSFVENFSFVNRQKLINAGMFNERINRYGGMSQEIRSRINSQGFEIFFNEEAKAIEITSSKMTAKRRQDIIESKFQLFKLNLN